MKIFLRINYNHYNFGMMLITKIYKLFIIKSFLYLCNTFSLQLSEFQKERITFPINFVIVQQKMPSIFKTSNFDDKTYLAGTYFRSKLGSL